MCVSHQLQAPGSDITLVFSSACISLLYILRMFQRGFAFSTCVEASAAIRREEFYLRWTPFASTALLFPLLSDHVYVVITFFMLLEYKALWSQRLKA